MRFLLSLFLCFFALSSAFAVEETARTAAIQKQYQSLNSFSADFTQILHHQESGAEEHREGSLIFTKPFRLRWETRKPNAELLVVNEKEVWDYLPDEETAYRYSPEVVNDSASVIHVVTGQSRLDKDFTVAKEPDDANLLVLRLSPKEPSVQMVEAILWIDKESNIIRRARILDFYGNTNELRFTKFTPNASATANHFRFTPPKNVSVEDLQDQSIPERPLLH